MEEDRQRRNTQAELGRDVVLEDEEGTLYFQCKDAGGKVVTLSITLKAVKFEMYVEGQGLKSETFRFEELRKWEVRNSKKKGESKEVVLDFGINRNPPVLVLISGDAEKIVAEIRSRVEELIAQKKEKGEVVADIKTQTRDPQPMMSFSEEFKKEFTETYNDLLGKKWFQLFTSTVGTVVSVVIIFGFMVATFVVVGITWDDSCNKPLQPWALVTALVSVVHIILDIVRLPIILIHTSKGHRYRIRELSAKSILLNPLLWVTVLYVILCAFWIAWFIVGLVWVERYSCSSTISQMVKALTYAFWHPVVSLYVTIFSIVALWKGPLYL